MIKLPFSQQEHLQIFPSSLASKTCVLPFDFALERDQKYIIYCERDLDNYTDQVFDFLSYDIHEYIHTDSSDL